MDILMPTEVSWNAQNNTSEYYELEYVDDIDMLDMMMAIVDVYHDSDVDYGPF